MKDIVANREKIGFLRKVRLLRVALHENGFLWTVHMVLYYAGSSIADWAHRRMNSLTTKHGLPGISSAAMNYEIWQNWDWEGGGEEWTESVEWKESLVRNILLRYMAEGGRILEVGPGAGRWTEALQRIAGRLIVVDISDKCIEICRSRFADCSNVEMFVNDGSDLSFIADDSVDSIWSFDVFVHINAQEAERYFAEFRRVLRAGGLAAIHHGQSGGSQGGWRSNLTSHAFANILAANSFKVLAQFDDWQEGELRFHISKYQDLLTVFEKEGIA